MTGKGRWLSHPLDFARDRLDDFEQCPEISPAGLSPPGKLARLGYYDFTVAPAFFAVSAYGG
jgi:hypothetical protein